MATHTLGPWIAGNLDGGPLAEREDEICVTTESGAVICTIWPMGKDFDLDESPERDANAILIASAPLLQEHVRILREALERFADFPVDGNENECAWRALDEIEREAKAALEATKGEG